jgi:hypothetical protein
MMALGPMFLRFVRAANDMTQQHCISFSAAIVIFGGQEKAAENKQRISAAGVGCRK